jgi:hypothetical protein
MIPRHRDRQTNNLILKEECFPEMIALAKSSYFLSIVALAALTALS